MCEIESSILQVIDLLNQNKHFQCVKPETTFSSILFKLMVKVNTLVVIYFSCFKIKRRY